LTPAQKTIIPVTNPFRVGVVSVKKKLRKNYERDFAYDLKNTVLISTK